ncbi:hypothetical protein B296_00052570 [Ensete ventricosum]|uniref:Uncharacterized protein n=1 Tax=Ensete ventricosum TaxID=4639 RepID=A0A426XJ37_ENSVE|nr:hypothetical protein B296_00052570 [Ensete ventricosum]
MFALCQCRCSCQAVKGSLIALESMQSSSDERIILYIGVNAVVVKRRKGRLASASASMQLSSDERTICCLAIVPLSNYIDANAISDPFVVWQFFDANVRPYVNIDKRRLLFIVALVIHNSHLRLPTTSSATINGND